MAEAPPYEVGFDGWTVLWVLLGGLVTLDLIAAAVHRHRTLSEHIWGRWFREPWKRVVFTVFWMECGVHFATTGQFWWSSGMAVACLAVPVAGLIAWREREMFGRVFGWVKEKAVKGWELLKHRGPLVSSILLGVGVAFPSASVLTSALAAALSGGQVPSGTELSKAVGELALGLLSVWGSYRKVTALIAARSAAGPPK